MCQRRSDSLLCMGTSGEYVAMVTESGSTLTESLHPRSAGLMQVAVQQGSYLNDIVAVFPAQRETMFGRRSRNDVLSVGT
jgi:hypothetical protein